MSKPSYRIPTDIEAALNDTGLPWTTEVGGKHIKLRLAGRLVGVCPRNGSSSNVRAQMNIISQIRRVAAEMRT